MINKKKLWTLIVVLIILSNGFIVLLGNEIDNNKYTLEYKIKADKLLTLETYYSDYQDILPNNLSVVEMKNVEQVSKFLVPAASKILRIDLGRESANLELSDLCVTYDDVKVALNINEILERTVKQNDIEFIQQKNDKLIIKTTGEDPYIMFNIESLNLLNWVQDIYHINLVKEKVLICIMLDVILILIAKFAIRLFIIPGDIFFNRHLVFKLARNDFKTKYVGSFFGVIWAFVQPFVTIVLYWFVFQIGLGAGDINGNPFVLWLIAGLVPWMFFQDAVLYGTNSLIEYSFLVKKVVFNISVLPIVKIVSAFIIHVAFLIISVLLFTIMGYFPGIQLIQVLYYSICAGVLAIGIVYASSAIVLFFKDLSQIINIVLQVGTWMTPIMWQIERIPSSLRWIFKLNPMYYVVQGYRDALLEKIWFCNRLMDTAYFWIIVLAMYAIGILIFQKLKPHFADVL